MQVKATLRIEEAPDTKGGDDSTHAQKGRPDPVTADAADPFFGRHCLGSVVQIQTKEMNGRTDQLNGGWNGQLGNQDLEILLRGDGVGNGVGEHGGETE